MCSEREEGAHKVGLLAVCTCRVELDHMPCPLYPPPSPSTFQAHPCNGRPDAGLQPHRHGHYSHIRRDSIAGSGGTRQHPSLALVGRPAPTSATRGAPGFRTNRGRPSPRARRPEGQAEGAALFGGGRTTSETTGELTAASLHVF